MTLIDTAYLNWKVLDILWFPALGDHTFSLNQRIIIHIQ